MICKYCDPTNNEPINGETEDYSLIEIAMVGHDKTMLRVRTFSESQAEGFDKQDVVCINYCPFCGRRLSLEIQRRHQPTLMNREQRRKQIKKGEWCYLPS